MAKSARIAKNTAYLTIASIMQKIISFGYYGYLAKSIGEANIGKYTFALMFTSVFIIFMDFGLGPLLTREGAKNESKLQEYFEKLFSIKIVLMVVVLLILFPAIHITDRVFTNVDGLDVQLVYIGAIIIVFDTLNFTFFSIFRSLKQMHWEAIGIVIYQATILGAGITALQLGLSLHFVLAALLAGSIVQCIYLFTIVRIKTDLRFRFRWSMADAKKILALSAPFAIAGILFRLNGSVDSIMLKIMAGDAYAGWYALSFKLTFALTVLPGAFATSYFPAVSQYYKEAKENLHTVFENGVFYMLLMSLPITMGVLILGDNIILSVWEYDWEASIEPLWILMIGLPFVFLNYPVGNFLNAVDKQRLNTLNMFIALLSNIVLNAILIPKYTFNGAAIAAVFSSILLVLLGLPWVYKIAPFSIWIILRKIILIAMSSGIMGFVLFFIQDHYNIYLLILISMLIYFGSIIILKAVTGDELRQLKKAIIRKG